MLTKQNDTAINSKSFLRTALLSGTAALLVTGSALAQDAAPAGADAGSIESVTVTGYRASLTDTTNTKRSAITFSDSIFAEDTGKFPDTNIAESLNRIPGVTISRDITGEGVNVSVRGLGTNFTKVLLNGSQIAVASSGPTDAQNANREVDLNMFPTELFTQLTVNKTPTADVVEGGAAGTVNLRSARPFDNPGMHITYSAQMSDYSNSGAFGPRGTLIVSDTEGPFGVLLGVTGQENRVMTTGFESIGWTSPHLTASQCASGGCNAIGGGNWTIPGTVPANVTTGGLVPGHTIDQAYLMQLNPGLSIQQISNALIPRLGRTMYEKGSRDRYNGVASFEYRPTNALHFYLDMMGGRVFNNLDRSDMDLDGRNGAMIPINEQVDANGVVTSATLANAQFSLEARPYKEKEDYFSINPGMDWQVNDLLHVDLQANATRSHFFRDSPTFMFNTVPSAGNPSGVPGATPPAGGIFVTFNNTAANSSPSITTNVDLNNPANFQWAGGRVNIQDEKRYTYTDGIHGDATYGGDEFNVQGGFAYDDAYRNITAYDNSQAFSNAICGDNPNANLPLPNSQPPCQGLNTATPPAGYPTYPGLGTGFSSGAPPLAWQGSLVPQSTVASFLRPGPTGFATVNFPAIEAASHYAAFDYPNAPFSTASNTGANSGTIDEKTWGLYGEANGSVQLGERRLKYNAGLRWVQTLQTVTGPESTGDPRNTATPALQDGGLFPADITFATKRRMYQAFLPSFNAVYEIADDFQVRASISRTMTRPDPSAMLPGVNFSDPSAQTASVGNADLKPFFSNNIDLGAEYYTGGEGYFSFSVFRKGISGFTVTNTTSAPFSTLAADGITFASLTPTQQVALNARGGPSTANIIVQQQVNASGLLTVNGMEFGWVQPLDFLLDRYNLKGFGVTANLTIVDQRSSGSAPAFATGISPYTYNLTGYYENDGAMVRLSYVFNDKSYASGSDQNGVCLPATSSATCPGGAYIFQDAYSQMDLSASYKLSKLFGKLPSDPELTFDAQNLTGSHLRSYFQFTNATYTDYNTGTLFLFGVRGTF